MSARQKNILAWLAVASPVAAAITLLLLLNARSNAHAVREARQDWAVVEVQECKVKLSRHDSLLLVLNLKGDRMLELLGERRRPWRPRRDSN